MRTGCIVLAALVAAGGCKKSGNAQKLEMKAQADATKPQIAVAAVDSGDICITHGQLDKSAATLAVNVPTFRAVALGTTGEAVALNFTYQGNSKETRALASGELRRQIGLKLRAANG